MTPDAIDKGSASIVVEGALESVMCEVDAHK